MNGTYIEIEGTRNVADIKTRIACMMDINDDDDDDDDHDDDDDVSMADASYPDDPILSAWTSVQC